MKSPRFLSPRAFIAASALTMAWLAFSAPSASALDLLNVNSTLTLTDPTQLGRLIRNSPGSEWGSQKPFPGILTPTTPYHYETFTLTPAMLAGLSYIQISLNDPTVSVFGSAYLMAYLPNPTATNRGLDVNYLGDNGASGDPLDGVPRSFRVVVPTGMSLVVVVNEFASTNSGIGQPFSLLVQGYTNAMYGEPNGPAAGPGVPETGTSALLLGIGCVALLAFPRLGSRRGVPRGR